MNTNRDRVTPEQARDQLVDSQNRRLSTSRDRRIHATGTATFGLSIGFFTATRNVFSGTSAVVATITYAIALIAIMVWVERVARTVPRRATIWSRVGIGGSLALALLVVLPWLNLQAQTEPNTLPMVLTGALVVALPSLGAGVVIARSES